MNKENSLGRPVRVAIMGLGAQGTNHLRAIHSLGRELAEITGLCDMRADRLADAKLSWPEAATSEDYREILASGDLDLVIVATMPNTHAEIAIGAMEAGASVLCEKPFAMCLSEAEKVFAVANSTGKQLQLGTNMRYMPECQYLHKLVDSGDVGKTVSCKSWGRHLTPPVWGPHYRRELSGGGVLASTLVHALDLSLWVGGSLNPVAVSAFAGQLFPGKRGAKSDEAVLKAYNAEDLMYAFVRFDTGAVYTLEGNWCDDRIDAHGFELITEKATLRNSPLEVMVDEDGEVVDRTPSVNDLVESLSRENNHEKFLENWSDSIRRQDEDVIRHLISEKPWTMQDERQLLNLQRVIDGCYESAKAGHEVEV